MSGGDNINVSITGNVDGQFAAGKDITQTNVTEPRPGGDVAGRVPKRGPDDRPWDVAISYASEDEALARQIHGQLHEEFRVFFAPEESGALWGTDLNRVLPNTYGVQSRYVLVLSTPRYIAKHWTRVEFDAVAASAPDRILMLELGALPDDLPQGLVYRGGSSAELIGLIGALRQKLAPPG